MSDKQQPKWYAYYKGAYKSARASEVQEPMMVRPDNWRYNVSTNIYNSKEEAQEAFNKAVVTHARDVMWTMKELARPKTLKRRLREAGRDDVADMFDQLEQMALAFYKQMLND